MSYIRLTKREKELQQKMTLEQYKNNVLEEAKKRLAKAGVHTLCVSHLREIKNQDNFANDVSSIVIDSIDYKL